MNHDRCIDIVLRGDVGPDREAAATHLSACPDCWAVVVAHHRDLTGEAPADADLASRSFACDRTRSDFDLIAGHSPTAIRDAFPVHARHLAQCPACRSRLAELRIVESEAADLPLIGEGAGAPWRWRETPLGRLRELAGSLRIGLDAARAWILEVPEGCVAMAGLQPALRGASDGQASSVRIELPLGDGAARLAIVVTATETRADLALRLDPPGATTTTIELLDDRDERLLASQSIVDGRAVLRDVPPGGYVLDVVDVVDPQSRARHRVALDLARSA